MAYELIAGDCLQVMRGMKADSVDLVLGSPPYTDARTYSREDIARGCQEWVEWMLDVTEAAVRVSKGLVLWVVAGVQRDLCYWPAPEGLCWEWWKRGNQLWRPCIWWKVDEDEGGTGIPGSGGKQWLRNDWEYVLAFKREGWLPWADPLVMGHPPIIPHLGGEMSNRTADGKRSNDRVGDIESRQQAWSDDPWGKRGRGNNLGDRHRNGQKNVGTNRRPNGEYKMPRTPVHDADGNLVGQEGHPMPKIANPGNVLPIIIKSRVGGGHMGSKLASCSEAPYPEKLAEFFVLSFCPSGGRICDPFSGSGTTGAVAIQHQRDYIGIDLRDSQIELSRKRLETVTPNFPCMV